MGPARPATLHGQEGSWRYSRDKSIPFTEGPGAPGGVYLSAPTVLSMDEVRHIYMMDNDKAADLTEISEDFPGGLPFHVSPVIEVRYKVRSDGTIRSDPETAHREAGDTLYEKRLPSTCGLCKAQELAAAATSGRDAEAS